MPSGSWGGLFKRLHGELHFKKEFEAERKIHLLQRERAGLFSSGTAAQKTASCEMQEDLNAFRRETPAKAIAKGERKHFLYTFKVQVWMREDTRQVI